MASAKSKPSSATAVEPAAIQHGAAELGVQLSNAQADLLVRYTQLLARWNRVHNLTAIDRPDEVISAHLLDSLSIIGEIDLFSPNSKLLDVGAGAGLPGIPVAISRPQLRVTLLDKVAKKVAFLTQAKAELGLANIECVHARAEDWRAAQPFRLIVARAYASLAQLVASTAHLIAPSGHWLAMKGALPRAEIDELARAAPGVRIVRTVKLRVPRLEAERHLIVMATH